MSILKINRWSLDITSFLFSHISISLWIFNYLLTDESIVRFFYFFRIIIDGFMSKLLRFDIIKNKNLSVDWTPPPTILFFLQKMFNIYYKMYKPKPIYIQKLVGIFFKSKIIYLTKIKTRKQFWCVSIKQKKKISLN